MSSIRALSLAARDAIEDLPTDFTSALSTTQQQQVLEAFSQLDLISKGSQRPKLFQLRCLISLLSARHVVLRAATGSGKTLAMILPLLLSPNKLAITVTPLKLLQRDHVQEFEQYGVPSIAINHDTPHDKTLWNRVSAGAFRNLLVAPEQFFPEGGHIPRLALLLKDQNFVKRIGFFFIDEAHFIITAGEPKAGEKLAFRAAYGNLAEVLVQLPLGVPVALFSATLPQLMLQRIVKSLNLSTDITDTFMLTTNRPNISHAVIPMVDSIKNLSNLDFLVSVPFHPPMSYPPKSIIFIDHKLSTAAVARYLNTRLPEAVRRVFKFRHLHSSMSMEHNEMVFDEFRKSNGLIQGVVATSGASTGINVADIRLVIQFGITIDICEHEQRAGRGGRDRQACLVLMIAEKWAYKSPENVHVSHKGKPTAKERRTEPAMLEFVNTSTCRRQFLAEYNNDSTAEAFEYNGPCCCDQHLDSTNINYFLPGTTLPSIALEARLELDTSGVDAQAPPKKTRKRYRPTKQRPSLEEQLKAWRTRILSNDPAIQSWPDEWVLSDLSISKLAREDEAVFKSAADIVSFLEESREWANSFADQVHNIINGYNRSLPRKSTRTSRKLVTSGATANRMPGSEDDEPEQHLPETHIPADPIPSLVNTAYHLYDTDATLVNSHSPPSSLPSSRCATPDLDLPLSAAVHHSRSESTFESPNPRPKKRALIGMDGSRILVWNC